MLLRPEDIDWILWNWSWMFVIHHPGSFRTPLSPGVWPEGSDGTDINALVRSHNRRVIAVADDFCKVHLFQYPCSKAKVSSAQQNPVLPYLLLGDTCGVSSCLGDRLHGLLGCPLLTLGGGPLIVSYSETRSCWPWIHSIPSAFGPQVLPLQVCTAIPGSFHLYINKQEILPVLFLRSDVI